MHWWVLFFVLLISSIQASFIFLDPSGDDTANCTYASPCSSLGFASSVADPGSTIKLAPGSYSIPYDIYFNVSVNIIGEPGVDLVCTSSDIIGLFVYHTSFSNISGITLRNCSGGINIYYAPSTSVTNCTITDGTSGIYVIFSNFVTILNCIISNMQSNYNAPIVAVSTSNFVIDGCTITNNTNSEEDGFYGGGLHLVNARNAKIRNCLFSANSATRGGAIISGDIMGDAEIDNCVFTSNHATWNAGGALYVMGSSTLTVFGSQFNHNTAAQGGGAIYLEQSSVLKMQSSNFVGNAAVNGGSIEADASTTVQINNCSFSNNSAQDRGGAMYMRSSKLVVNESILNENLANSGGAMYLLRVDNASMIGTQVDTNTARSEFGGGLYLESSVVSLAPSARLPCVFSNNFAQVGGAIYSKASSAKISMCEVTQNTAFNSGGIHSLDSVISIDNTTVTLNNATGKAGAFGVFGTSRTQVQNSSVNFNSAGIGGGMYLDAGYATISYCDFTANEATSGSGAAIEITTAAEMNLRVIYTRITNSIAPFKFCCMDEVGYQNWTTSDMAGVICDYPACNTTQCAISPSDTCLCASPAQPCECDGEMIGPYCTVYNKCQQSDFCPPFSVCSTANYTFDCSCLPGYALSSGGCTDIDECATGQSNCSLHEFCVNTPGSYNCSCLPGFRFNGTDCLDIDECAIQGCTAHATCSNYEGGYTCTCNIGFQLESSICVDINECDTGDYICSRTSYCVNVIGTYSCIECLAGFESNGTNCFDINECTNTTICEPDYHCLNVPGSFTCSRCQPGFQFIGVNCSDINECLSRNGGCDYHTLCTNTLGSRLCGDCPQGYTGNGYASCTAQCGNSACESELGENCVSCPIDCGSVSCGICGDHVCGDNENCTTCMEDCLCNTQKPCPDMQCSGHGTCNNGTCKCAGSWNGPSCESANIPINVTIPPDKPVITINPATNVSFSLSISEIREIDIFGNASFSISLLNIDFSSFYDVSGDGSSTDAPTTQQWLLNATLENNAYILVHIWLLMNDTNITFANTSFSFLPHTVKFSFEIGNWPFRSLKNYLQIIMDYNTTQSHTCEGGTKSNVDAYGNLKWLTLSIDNITLYGEFSDVAVVDGVVRKINFTLGSNTVIAHVPHFWSYAEIDPSFSVLLNDPARTPQCNSASTYSSISKLMLVVVVLALTLLVVSIMVWTLLRRRISLRYRLWKEQKNLDSQQQVKRVASVQHIVM